VRVIREALDPIAALGSRGATQNLQISAYTLSVQWPGRHSESAGSLPAKGPSHIARHVRKKTARDGRLSDGAEALYARSAVSYGSALKKSGTKSLVFHRRCREEETRCLSAPPWTPMLCLQSDCPSGPNQMNSDIGRTGSTKIHFAAE